jgi:hypothetical protein
VTGLPFRIVRRQMHEYTDAPHAFTLLRPHCVRPRSGTAAEKRDELAPSELTKLHPPPLSQGDSISDW